MDTLSQCKSWRGWPMQQGSPGLRIALVEQETFYLPNMLASLAKTGCLDSIILYLPKRSWKAVYSHLIRNARAFGWMGLIACGVCAFIARCLDLIPGRFYSVQKVARVFTLPVFKIHSLKELKGLLAVAADRKPTIFAQISDKISPDLLACGDFINKHCGLLPAYRGVYPVYWAMLNGEASLGVTLHRMDSGFDTGPILEQRKISAKNHSFFGAHHELYDLATAMVRVHLNGRGVLGARQEPAEGSYYSYPCRADRVSFLRKRRLGLPLRFHPAISSK